MFTAASSAQQYDLGIPGVKPLKTSRKTFEKIYASPLVTNPENKIYKYQTDTFYIEVTYTGKSCSDENYGEYDVPTNTLLSATVRYRKPVKLSQLNFDANRFSKDESGDVGDFYQYIDRNNGVTIRVRIRRGDDQYVSSVDYYPNSSEENRRRCSSKK